MNRSEQTAQALRKALQEFVAHIATDVKVVPEAGGERYRAILLRGARESELPKIFSREFVDDLPGTKEYQKELRELAGAALDRLLLQPDHRRAALLAALDSCNEHWPGQLVGASWIRSYYARYSGGDVINEADLFYLSDKGQIEFFHRPPLTPYALLRNPRNAAELSTSNPRFMVLAQEPFAARILAEGKDSLEAWLQQRRNRPTKVYEIFVSSCQDEMEDERITVREAVEDDQELRNCFRVVLFEDDMTPSTGSPKTETTGAARRCDIYIGLFGARYGEPGGDGLSPTEREYRAAAEDADSLTNKAIWLFRQIKCKDQEEPRLRELLKEIAHPETGRTYAEFRNIRELRLAIRRKLRRFIEEQGFGTS